MIEYVVFFVTSAVVTYWAHGRGYRRGFDTAKDVYSSDPDSTECALNEVGLMSEEERQWVMLANFDTSTCKHTVVSDGGDRDDG